MNEDEDGIEYSFAMEYHGPPLTYDLPRAIPIDIKRIPIASVVSPTSARHELSLPVVQPLIASDSLKKKYSKEVTDIVVSPTSVITFEHSRRAGPDCELSGECSSSGMLGSPNGHQVSDVIDRMEAIESSNDCTLEFCNNNEMGRSPSDCKERVHFSDDGNLPEWNSTESASSSHFLSSEISCETGDLTSCHARRSSVVTFRDGDSISSDTLHDGFSSIESENNLGRKEPERKAHKGSCYRCFKGNRFSEKEACIVCNSKYCANCVLRAMGSMPEGRKCVSCIGFPIDESKRGNLGKCSRMLKRLLSELETRQIMKVEKFCEANQLQAEHVYVNGQQLCQEEMVLLQSCPNPPTKLKPGCYWYDKVSGLWGKEGEKPCKIISPHLSIGGDIMRNASNGNTNVFINNREITKVELRLLQLAGVQCAGNPHFWLDEYGSYQEEGQKNVKGNLWSKAGTKLLCAVLSLPIPSSKVANPSAEEVNTLVSGAIPEYLKQRTLHKLLLVGNNGSGTSTIFKQAKMLYKAAPFSQDERQDIKLMIQRNVYRYLGILLEGRERFEEESLAEMRRKRLLDQPDSFETEDKIQLAPGCAEGNDKSIYSIGPRLKAFSDWLLKIMVSGNLDDIFPAASREYAPLVEELWKDAAIRATFNRRNELKMLPSVASYFLERVVDISRTDYEPSNVDILYVEGITSSNGLACLDFSFPQSAQQGIVDAGDQHDPLLRYQLIRIDARGLGENCKWLEMFENVRMVIFCIALSDYDQFIDDASGAPTNKILASRKLFQEIITHPTFEEMDFLLILNKFDLLKEKIERVPLRKCTWFADFNLVVSHRRSNNSNSINYVASPAEQAFHYIAVKFKRLFSSLTGGRKLYVSSASGLEPDSINGALRYAREILKWDEEKNNFSVYDSMFSTETSSFSP